MGTSLDTIARAMATTIQQAVAPLLEKFRMAEHRMAALEERSQRIGELRERVAVLETRQLPGPPGPAGADGLGFDDMSVTFDGVRTLELTFTRGTVVKSFPVFLPLPVYRGTYEEGKCYDPGDELTHDGSLWQCLKPTTVRPGGNTAWQMKLRKGPR